MSLLVPSEIVAGLIWCFKPVALGLVGSFAHPGGNITGFLMSGDAAIVGKRLELLREAAPRFSRVGVLVAPDYAAAAGTLDALPSAARGVGCDAHHATRRRCGPTSSR